MRDLQLYLFSDYCLIYEDIDLFGRSGDTCNVMLVYMASYMMAGYGHARHIF
jgi:hypothetical protein